MKTAIDLPDDLFREVKLRAASQGRKLKDVIAELLRLGLSSPLEVPSGKARIGRDERTGLPVVLGGHPAAKGKELTPERVKEILLEQEVEWHREASR